ncbi:MAG: GTPase domain-containing protein [Candidatus Thorarchaeota archaeon]|nr:GTPase domain-containing protein [Candidatus Thorarchaeota archaeon]
MPKLRGLFGRLKKKKEPERLDESSSRAKELSSSSISTSSVPDAESSSERVPPPMETFVASATSATIDVERTTTLAREAKIERQRTDEIVPGHVLKRDELGRIHIKIVFYGPSLSGKTTALRWLFANVRSLSKGRIVEIADELGRTTFFDFIPVTACENIVFDVFTVAGQRRHAKNRITVLRGADGVIFMADSRPEAMQENIASIQELRIALGTDRVSTMPIIVALNKRDLPNALPVDYMIKVLEVQGYPTFETIATQGKNLLRMFQRVLRDALIFKVGI